MKTDSSLSFCIIWFMISSVLQLTVFVFMSTQLLRLYGCLLWVTISSVTYIT